MPLTEVAKLVVRDLKLPRIAQRLVAAAVFLVDDEDLEALPPLGADGADGRVHVLPPVVSVDDGVDFEHDPVLLTQFRQLFEFLQVLARAPADLHVGGFVEGVARDGYDVDVLAVCGQPGGRHFAAVGDDGDRFEREGGFAVLGQLAEEFGVHEGLPAGEVDFAHPGFFEKEHGAFGIVGGLDVGCFCCVEAEP